MSMSECSKCWDTPCTCGWGYRYWAIKKLKSQIKMLQEVLSKKEKGDKK